MLELEKREVVVQTAWERYHSPPEKDFGPSLVEPGESLPIAVQIERMMVAGQRLNAFNVNYEFGPDDTIPEDYMDPTRNPGYDMADASMQTAELEARLVEASRRVSDKPSVGPIAASPRSAGKADPSVQPGSDDNRDTEPILFPESGPLRAQSGEGNRYKV